MLAENTAAPFFLMGSVSDSSTSPLAGTFFTGGYPLLTSTTFLTAYIQPHPKRDYLMQWNLNVQRQVTPNLTAMIGYIGSHGVHQPFRTDEFDNVTPQPTSAGYLVPVNGTTLNPNFGTIQGVVYNNTSSFNALEVGIQRSMSHGLRAQGSFTWGRVSTTTPRRSREISFQTRSTLYGTISTLVQPVVSRILTSRGHWFLT